VVQTKEQGLDYRRAYSCIKGALEGSTLDPLLDNPNDRDRIEVDLGLCLDYVHRITGGERALILTDLLPVTRFSLKDLKEFKSRAGLNPAESLALEIHSLGERLKSKPQTKDVSRGEIFKLLLEADKRYYPKSDTPKV
jgi:hypothetical protein